MIKLLVGIGIIISALICCYFGNEMISATFEQQHKSELWFIISLITMLGFILIGKVVFYV